MPKEVEIMKKKNNFDVFVKITTEICRKHFQMKFKKASVSIISNSYPLYLVLAVWATCLFLSTLKYMIGIKNSYANYM